MAVASFAAKSSAARKRLVNCRVHVTHRFVRSLLSTTITACPRWKISDNLTFRSSNVRNPEPAAASLTRGGLAA